MQVHIQNDGPVTLHIESPRFPPPKEVYTHNTPISMYTIHTALLLHVCMKMVTTQRMFYLQRKVQGGPRKGEKKAAVGRAEGDGKSNPDVASAVAELTVEGT